ncbi:MAG: branched-chain amino acid ABC transporter permease [Chloroflexota bacterium]|nr:branched-chain amino acid ABC transporter permease [Chloroflexota bacterium]
MATTLTATESFDARRERDQARRKVLLFSGVAVLMFLYPFVDRALEWNRLGSWIAIFVFVILAVGLNIVVGYAGLLDLGYAAFFIIGAYANAFLSSPSSILVRNDLVPGWLQSFWPAMAVSWLVAALFGVLLGAPTLRLRGDYLAIVTLGFGEIVPNFFVNAQTITGGPGGISRVARPPTIPLPGGHEIKFATTDQQNWYWLILAIGIFTVFLTTRLYDSRLGRAWQAVREDEIAAASMGVNLVKTKLWAFALGASFSGFAGSVYAGYLRVVYPDQFEFSVSVIVLAMVILGGLGNVYGVIFGGLILQSFDRILAEEINTPLHWLGDTLNLSFVSNHDVQSDRFLIFGLALVLTMLLRPGGLFPNARRQAELAPESEEAAAHADQSIYDARAEDEPVAGERA